ncbi:MAG: hypothetical protein A2066_12975 [Bacteroidetes bacterium GWB2_41_8]|nr:MAG: hypothetical protein A2066_12975 [Bacteroidetes bacterium GWB2_41_8]
MPGYKPETWNPIVGCSKVSPGCDNCYAEKQAFIRAFNPNTPQYKSVVVKHPLDPRYREWNGTTQLVNSALTKPSQWKDPRMVFVCSMGDLFHESVSFETIEQIYDIMHSNDQHIFIVLTKRPERMYKFWDWLLNKIAGVGIHDVNSTSTDNVWIGVTAENQEQANNRIPVLLQIPAAKRFVSIEPMLGPVDLTKIPAKYWGEEYDDLYNGLSLSSLYGGKDSSTPWHLNWVICGGESGPKARPMHPDWVRSVRDQCQSAGTPFFFKQWGEWMPFQDATALESSVPGPKIISSKMNRFDDGEEIIRVGRKAARDLLDGKQHHEWPKINL